jgi:hypothetical protein
VHAEGDFAPREGTRLLNIALQTLVSGVKSDFIFPRLLKALACRNERTETADRNMMGKHSVDETEVRICEHTYYLTLFKRKTYVRTGNTMHYHLARD